MTATEKVPEDYHLEKVNQNKYSHLDVTITNRANHDIEIDKRMTKSSKSVGTENLFFFFLEFLSNS